MTRVLGPLLAALAKRGVNLPKPDPKTHEFGSPVLIPQRTMAVTDEKGRPMQPDIAGFDKRADREARWRRDGCLELEKLVPFMKNAGVKAEIVAHAEEVLRDLQEQRRKKYPGKLLAL